MWNSAHEPTRFSPAISIVDARLTSRRGASNPVVRLDAANGVRATAGARLRIGTSKR